MKIFSLTLALGLGCLASAPAKDAARATAAWESSVVKIEVTQKKFDYYQPWNQRTARTQKLGMVIGPKEILTPAEHLSEQTLVRVQKRGRGKWWIGKTVWVDYPANLAQVSVDGDDFWSDLQPVKFGGAIPEDGSLQMIRWKDGVLESAKATFVRYLLEESQTSGLSHVHLKAHTELNDGGWGELLVADSHVVGLTVGMRDNLCNAMPASFIQMLVQAHQGAYRGLGYFPFYWQKAENTASLDYLGLKGEPRGVFVTRVPPPLDGSAPQLQPRDVILQIDGFDIDIQGDYLDPEFGFLSLENLALRGKWAGDEVRMKILRAGQEKEIAFRLPKYEYENWRVPAFTFDREPEYLILGGLVFQPLTTSYLRAWGEDWKRRAPFHLNYHTENEATTNEPGVVILSQVLPDSFNIGYQDQRFLVVEKVNARPITQLAELREAFQHPQAGFHRIEFRRGNDLQRVVLAAGEE
ncbi:MAG: hypothetical protein EPO07_14420, partial [Verrucomicrobia bacterium]